MNNRDFLIISIFTFITTLVWIFFDAYHTYKTSTIPEDLRIQMEPLNTDLPIGIIQQLKDRPEFFSISVSPSPLPTASPTVIPSPTVSPVTPTLSP
jgi:hypothetical protein